MKKRNDVVDNDVWNLVRQQQALEPSPSFVDKTMAMLNDTKQAKDRQSTFISTLLLKLALPVSCCAVFVAVWFTKDSQPPSFSSEPIVSQFFTEDMREEFLLEFEGESFFFNDEFELLFTTF